MTNDVTATFTEAEFLLLNQAVKGYCQGLEDYKRWIDDRPMLPERELAVSNLAGEIRKFWDLRSKLFDIAKPAGLTHS
jgi:hypothetical protein